MISFRDKYKLIKRGMESPIYSIVLKNKDIKLSSNPFYQFALKSRKVLLFLLI